MGEWIGVNYIFVIYRVKQGWSIERLAAHYDTTAAALMAVNYRLITPLYPGQLIVIPINQVDVSGLPQFEAYQVTEDISLEELAERLSVDPFQLQYFNGFGMDEQITAREWIIVPRERTK
jgi:LysM repeat protein